MTWVDKLRPLPPPGEGSVMAPQVSYDTQQAAYRMVVDELQSMTTATGSCAQLGDPVVDSAVRYILGMPNDWELTTISAVASFTPRTQEQLATAASVLTAVIAGWSDFDEKSMSGSWVRIDEVMGYVDEENVPEDLRD